jgi:general secretion pathway protein E
VREDASPQALAEVRRSLGLPLRLQRVGRAPSTPASPRPTGADGNAAEVVADVGQEVDLDRS